MDSIRSQWKSLLFWLVAGLLIVSATIFYQPAAAKTGSLLVWTQNRIYVMDIDSLTLRRVGPAGPDEVMAPSPGCFGQTDTPCWAVVGQMLYRIDPNEDNSKPGQPLPLGEGFDWIDSPVSWSPDGVHVAYSVRDKTSELGELRVHDAATAKTKITIPGVDPKIAVAWTTDCGVGLNASGCHIGYKTMVIRVGKDDDTPSHIVALTPSTGGERQWEIPVEPIFELRWSPDNTLLYSKPKRYFRDVETHVPIYRIPPGGELANISPDGHFTVYYQPFTLSDCQEKGEQTCLHVGIWLAQWGYEDNKPTLIYDVDLAHTELGGLNFIPIWSTNKNGFVFFQEGNLVYYDLQKLEATIWYKQVQGKLRSVPVFSPNEEAIAFVDNQGQGFSEYRLVVVNPRLQPIEHIIDTKSGFRVLAWLPQ